MKLFQRTLCSFAGVIALQAVLAGAAISSILGSIQAEDASRELVSESTDAIDSFNAWKLAFWKDINELDEDPRVARAVAGAARSPAADAAVEREVSRRLSGSAASAVALRDARDGRARYVEAGLYAEGGALPADLPRVDSFYFKKAHPYVEIVSAAGELWFLGAARVPPMAKADARGPALEVYILKRIDEGLLEQLSYDPMVAVAVLVPGLGPKIEGSHEGTGRSSGLAADFALSLAHSEGDDRAYVSYPPADWRGGRYAAVVQRAGTVAVPGGERPVILAAALSLAEYSAREARLRNSIVAVTAAVVALTIVMALLLSRSIVSPIRNLSRAMRRIEGGDYRAEVRGPVSGEIGELLAGFNAMAKKLASDKLELEAYIAEIVGLKERGEGIIESIREGLAVVDSGGRVESSNASFRGLFGEASGAPGTPLSEVGGGPFDEVFAAALREALRDRASRGGITRRAPDGRTFEIKLYPLASAARPEDARCIVVVEDASERLAYEERAIQADRLASIGILSAGIAHEINNPLSSILANVGNAIAEAKDPEAVASLRVVESETLRIARIVRQLLDFSAPRADGRGEEAPRCDPNAAARELVRLVGYPFREEGRIAFAESLDPRCPAAAISEDELKQVLLNLLKNALHAVGGSGRIEVSTRASGAAVEVSVADDGPGIPEDIMGRIFDPFFTTRAGRAGAGLGLGLSVVYGIVTKRGGAIRASNAPGGGGLFVVSLPAAGKGAA